jgi:tryptophan-rich sensory protein
MAAFWILIAMVVVAVGLNPSKAEFSWFLRLRRPRWLVFEGLIPVIWLVIYACFYASALLSWNAAAGWNVVMGYLALLVLVQSYTLVICRSRSLARGTLIGFAGWVWGIALTLVVAQHSLWGWLLLLPYLIWSPVGTFVTWQMQKLNR